MLNDSKQSLVYLLITKYEIRYVNKVLKCFDYLTNNTFQQKCFMGTHIFGNRNLSGEKIVIIVIILLSARVKVYTV